MFTIHFQRKRSDSIRDILLLGRWNKLFFWSNQKNCSFSEWNASFLNDSERIFWTDFLNGFSERIFWTDFLIGFSEPIFWTDFLNEFSEWFLTILNQLQLFWMDFLIDQKMHSIVCSTSLTRTCCGLLCLDLGETLQNQLWMYRIKRLC